MITGDKTDRRLLNVENTCYKVCVTHGYDHRRQNGQEVVACRQHMIQGNVLHTAMITGDKTDRRLLNVENTCYKVCVTHGYDHRRQNGQEVVACRQYIIKDNVIHMAIMKGNKKLICTNIATIFNSSWSVSWIDQCIFYWEINYTLWIYERGMKVIGIY